MNKAYNKITWQNKPSTATPLNQTNLNEMSNALDTIDDRVIALDSGKVSSVTVTNTLPTGDTIATITVDGTATNIKSAQVVVDSTPSATSENPLQNKAIYEMMNNLLPEETVQGNPIAISDASGLNAKACSVDLLPIQDLHGYDSPWVGGAGKNKCNPSLLLDQVGWNTFTIQLKANTQYTMSSNIPQNKTAELPLYFLSGSANPGSSTLVYSGQSVTMTSDENGEVRVQQRRVSGTDSFQNYQWQIEEGNQATSFAPYSNICPISGRTQASVKRTGKNLVDIDEIVEGKMLTTTDGTIENGTNKLYVTDYIYVVKGVPVFIPSTGTSRRWFYDLNKVGSVYINYAYQQAYIPPENGYIRVTATTDTIAKDELQIEYGTTASTYEPYQGETKEITLPQTVYEGNVNVVDGGATSTYKAIDIGDMTFTYRTDGSSVNPNYFLVTPKQTDHKPVADNEINYICSCYKSAKYYDFNRENLDGSILFSGAYNNLVIIDTRYTDATSIKTALAGQTLCYELATPIELTTSAEQISLLKGNNVVSTDGDNIILKYSADIKAWVENQLQS